MIINNLERCPGTEKPLKLEIQQMLEKLDDPRNSQTPESDLRTLVNIAEYMRKDGNYSEADMREIIKRADARIERV